MRKALARASLLTPPIFALLTGFINVYMFSPPELDESAGQTDRNNILQSVISWSVEWRNIWCLPWGDGIIGVPGPGGPDPGGPCWMNITVCNAVCSYDRLASFDCTYAIVPWWWWWIIHGCRCVWLPLWSCRCSSHSHSRWHTWTTCKFEVVLSSIHLINQLRKFVFYLVVDHACRLDRILVP